MRVVVTPHDHMTAHEPTTAYGINGKTVQGSWEQLSSSLLLCHVTWMWRSHCSPHEAKSPSGGGRERGELWRVLLWPLKKIRVSKTKGTVKMKSWQSPRKDDHIWNLTEREKLCPMPLPVQQENTNFLILFMTFRSKGTDFWAQVKDMQTFRKFPGRWSTPRLISKSLTKFH